MGVMLFSSKDQDIWSWSAHQAYWLYIIGVKNLWVEIDVSYIKGILINPDIHSDSVVNRWIIVIKLFQFELVHVPGDFHMGPDGLSCQAASPNDPIEEDNVDDWLDRTMSFSTTLMNSQPSWTDKLNSSYHQPDPMHIIQIIHPSI